MLGLSAMAKVHGVFNIGGGLWPLLHMRSFEGFFGPKTDRWLVRAVAGLLVGAGSTQLRASTPDELAQARWIGITTATTLLLIDLYYVPRGRIRWTYLIDGAGHASMLAGWAVASRSTSTRGA